MDDERDSPTGRSRSIVPHGGAIRSELALLALIIGTLAATCNLLLAIHRHADTMSRSAGTPATVALDLPSAPTSVAENRPSSPVKPVSPKPAIVQQPTLPVEVLPPPEDPHDESGGRVVAERDPPRNRGRSQQADRSPRHWRQRSRRLRPNRGDGRDGRCWSDNKLPG